MKERPILFSAPMVRAILEGRKTMTRRVVKGMALEWLSDARFTPAYVAMPENDMCPYGQPGDRLWVRETWQGPLLSEEEMLDDPSWYHNSAAYRDPAHCAYRASDDSAEFVDPDGDMQCRWRPSIHMPRWASRITLEVTGVRVERLQDISEADAIAEGIQQCEGGAMDYLANDYAQGYSPVASFRSLWESINGAGSWDANPWVWVVEFKRVEIAP